MTRNTPNITAIALLSLSIVACGQDAPGRSDALNTADEDVIRHAAEFTSASDAQIIDALSVAYGLNATDALLTAFSVAQSADGTCLEEKTTDESVEYFADQCTSAEGAYFDGVVTVVQDIPINMPDIDDVFIVSFDEFTVDWGDGDARYDGRIGVARKGDTITTAIDLTSSGPGVWIASSQFTIMDCVGDEIERTCTIADGSWAKIPELGAFTISNEMHITDRTKVEGVLELQGVDTLRVTLDQLESTCFDVTIDDTERQVCFE